MARTVCEVLEDGRWPMGWIVIDTTRMAAVSDVFIEEFPAIQYADWYDQHGPEYPTIREATQAFAAQRVEEVQEV